jgi:hypothetical protein
MIAPKSAIDPAATTSWPNRDAISPASLSTGMITPSDVAERITATSSGVSARPPAFSARPARTAIPKDRSQPPPATRRRRPRSLSNSTSRPARKRRKTSPIVASTEIVSSISTHPSPAGPIAIPAVISSTTAGRRTLGKKPSRNGAANATAHQQQAGEGWLVHALSVGQGREALRRG